MLQSLVSAAGWEAVPFETVADTFDATRDALQRASDEADIIVTTGGVSVGEEDHIRDAIQSLGQLNLWRMAIKPGKPLAFGHIGDTPILGLPGNPAAVLVTFLMLGRPFLRCCQGKVVRRSRPPMHCHWALRYPGSGTPRIPTRALSPARGAPVAGSGEQSELGRSQHGLLVGWACGDSRK